MMSVTGFQVRLHCAVLKVPASSSNVCALLCVAIRQRDLPQCGMYAHNRAVHAAGTLDCKRVIELNPRPHVEASPRHRPVSQQRTINGCLLPTHRRCWGVRSCRAC